MNYPIIGLLISLYLLSVLYTFLVHLPDLITSLRHYYAIPISWKMNSVLEFLQFSFICGPRFFVSHSILAIFPKIRERMPKDERVRTTCKICKYEFLETGHETCPHCRYLAITSIREVILVNGPLEGLHLQTEGVIEKLYFARGDSGQLYLVDPIFCSNSITYSLKEESNEYFHVSSKTS